MYQITTEQRKQILSNIRALLPKISSKLNDVERETNLFEGYIEDGRNYEILDRKCYELKDLINELIFKLR